MNSSASAAARGRVRQAPVLPCSNALAVCSIATAAITWAKCFSRASAIAKCLEVLTLNVSFNESLVCPTFFLVSSLPVTRAAHPIAAMSDDEARTDTVDLLHSYPHHQPKTGSDFIESEYYTSLIYLAAIVGGIGVILLVVHALYRICLACRSCCCRRCCCTCVERWTKGRRGRMRLLLGFTLLGVCGGVLSWKAAEVELQRGVSNVADSLDTLQDFLGHLGDVTADMLKSTGKITEAASSIECSGSELDDYLGDVSYVNASVADVAAIFDDMIDPVDTAEDQVRSNGRRYVRLVVPVALAAPFALYVLFALCGVGVSKAYMWRSMSTVSPHSHSRSRSRNVISQSVGSTVGLMGAAVGT